MSGSLKFSTASSCLQAVAASSNDADASVVIAFIFSPVSAFAPARQSRRTGTFGGLELRPNRQGEVADLRIAGRLRGEERAGVHLTTGRSNVRIPTGVLRPGVEIAAG